ncbi:hypothetical protein SAMN05519105_1072 [Rhodobacter sp. 24-YEA-8]|nr:hypothetical protein SAMN05519105_1072 [Rhodobacter sp. 24-YEA-8]
MASLIAVLAYLGPRGAGGDGGAVGQPEGVTPGISCAERLVYFTVTVTQPANVPFSPSAVFFVQNLSLPLKPAVGV